MDFKEKFYLSDWASIRLTVYGTATFIHGPTTQPAEYLQ